MLDEPLAPGTVLTCKIIGGIKYIDEKGQDDKLIVCPANNVDPRFMNINNITNLKPQTLNKIRYFFQHYKDNLNIITKVGEFLNREQAIQIYNQSKI